MARESKITIDDIARSARVSKSTVSRVLNDAASVTAEKRTAILAAIAELNYQPDIFARGLVSGNSMVIGVVTQDIGSPIYDAMLRGVLQGLNGSGYASIFADGKWQADKEQAAIHALLDRRVDGLIILGGQSKEQTLNQIGERLPIVVVGRDLPLLTGHCLKMDDFQGAYCATRFLIEAGHRRIVHVTGLLTHEDAIARRAGYHQALIDAKLEPDPELEIEGNYLEQSGVLAVEMLLTRGRHFSAIFAANDQMALGVRLALYRRGIRVPDDVSLIGFDDQPVAAYMTPPLTTIRQPALEIGEIAAQALLHLLKRKPYTVPLLETNLVVRESVARAR